MHKTYDSKRFIFKVFLYGVIVLVLIFVIYSFFAKKSGNSNLSLLKAEVVDLKESVLATGQVTPVTDLSLSFYGSGIVKSLKVKVGDMVKEGTVLATLDQKSELAALTSARGAVAAAEAKYQKILAGASNEEIELAKVALENAKQDYARIVAEQEILVKNAYKNLLNSTPEALPATTTSDFTAPVVTGNYNKDKEGEIRIHIYAGGSGFNVSGLVNGSGSVTASTAQPIGDSGLYINFPGNSANISEWIISIPNKKASNYITNYNAYDAALKTRDSAVGIASAQIGQKTAELTLKQSSARPADIELAKADILSAQGEFEKAAANLENTILRAPASGTITKIDVKLGELAQALEKIVVLQDVSNLYIEVKINEANIVNLRVGQNVMINFDAFGKDRKFTGKIIHIDPSAETSDGVVNYKIKVAVNERDESIRPEMNANIEILVGEVKSVLAIPKVAITEREGRKFVKVLINGNKNKYEEKEVVTGFIGDNNLAEIISGLNPGNEIGIEQ